MSNIPEESWLRVFTEPALFRKLLIENPQRVRGLSESERQRLIGLSDDDLCSEMRRNLDLTECFNQ